MNALLGKMAEARAIPVLRSASPEEAFRTARGFAYGGMRVIELTFSTPGVLHVIRELSRDPDIVVGAGTVLTETQAVDAIAAGARFLVSPVWLPWLPRLVHGTGVEAIPGASTPTEVFQAHAAGAAAVKVFPIARLGGAAYIRDLLAPMPELRLMATGGVSLALARQLLDAGCFAVGVGTVATGAGDANLPPYERAARYLDTLATLAA